MKIFHLSIIVLFFFTFHGLVNGQNIKENELVVIQGEKFILHQVRTGETIYSISRDFKVKSTELQKYNPKISEGLSIGEILKIPFNESVDLSQIPTYKKGDPSGFLNYTIESRGETAYAISKQYGITVEELYAYNPSVRKLKKGTTLKIPQWNDNSKPEIAGNENLSKSVSDKPGEKDGFIVYTVVSGETLYSIGKKFNLSEIEILTYNPEAKNLKAGTKLYLPAKSGSESESMTPGIRFKYIEHTVVSGETLYGISQKYHVSQEELTSVNPGIKSGFRTGTIIKIPVIASEPGQISITPDKNLVDQVGQIPISEQSITGNVPGDCGTGSYTYKTRPVKVAVFLPLFLDANEKLNKDFIEEETDTLEQAILITEVENDSIIEEEKPVQLLKQFYGNSENFLQFYEGVITAVDSIQKKGMRVELSVFDSRDNPESVRRTIYNESFSNTDLIIGPVYENVQLEVAKVALANHIPMVSPFTPKSDVLRSNPLFFQINPSREYLAEATAEMIAEDYSGTNFIVVRTSPYESRPEGQMVELIRRKLLKAENSKGKYTDYDFRRERAAGLTNILSHEQENVVFIPSSDEGELSVAISNINNLASEYSITLIGAGNYQQKYPSIEVAHYHNLKFKYINPYWINYQDSTVVDYFEKFITDFGTEPNSYGVQGFDVTWYFLNTLYNYGDNFEACLPYINIKLIQGNYSFKKVSATGGFMNEGVSVISYNRNFEVKQERIMRQ